MGAYSTRSHTMLPCDVTSTVHEHAVSASSHEWTDYSEKNRPSDPSQTSEPRCEIQPRVLMPKASDTAFPL
jgi:hypothetical protein